MTDIAFNFISYAVYHAVSNCCFCARAYIAFVTELTDQWQTGREFVKASESHVKAGGDVAAEILAVFVHYIICQGCSTVYAKNGMLASRLVVGANDAADSVCA